MAYGFFVRSVKTDQTGFCHAQVQISEIICVLLVVSWEHQQNDLHQPCLIKIFAMHSICIKELIVSSCRQLLPSLI